MALAVAQAVQAVQAVPAVQVAQEVVAARSPASWAGAWPPTESQVPCWTPAVGYLAAVQKVAAVAAPWGSLAGALFSWAAAVVVAGG